MCLQLTYAEALLWKKRAAGLVADSKVAAAKIACDPLFTSNPRLSSLVSEVDSIKKRHGLLIESALIYAINKLPSWIAKKEQVLVLGGKAHLDCLAFNSKSGKLYVFECKRGHGRFDADKKQAIDQRLDRVAAALGPHATANGWVPTSMETFILSFYGATWKSKYPIYDRFSVGTVFGPCIGKFLGEYMDHIQATTAGAYGDELREPIGTLADRSIFDQLDAGREEPWPDVLFTESGAEFVAATDGNPSC